MRRDLYPGGPGYPSLITWELISALVRYVRAGNKCEWCDIDNGAQVAKLDGSGTYPVILTVAHLDQDKSNSLDPANLAALCQLDHLTLDQGSKQTARRNVVGQLAFDVGNAGNVDIGHVRTQLAARRR